MQILLVFNMQLIDIGFTQDAKQKFPNAVIEVVGMFDVHLIFVMMVFVSVIVVMRFMMFLFILVDQVVTMRNSSVCYSQAVCEQ